MRVTVRYFASLREAAGRTSEQRDMPEGALVADLLASLASDYPALAGLQAASMPMVNQEYVEVARVLRDGDEFALIPPVSGGSSRFAVVEGPIDVQAISDSVAGPGAGAIVTFVGTVRDAARGQAVRHLEYEAYAAAAERMLARVGDEIRERWGIERVAITHRVGRLDVGDASVAIAVASAHRAEAFDACRYAIDRIKEIVPIWKKEFYAEGETWIGSEADYQARFGHSGHR
ncbi:MAG TPA: MoaD family protein [Thermomicrobiaceae bacterium]|nr:MoaD family protein [Thermomicrobiaceae bacterium]